jgi:hypothetical protein
MKNKRGFKQAIISGAVFCGLILAVSFVDPRVREHMERLVYGSGGLTSFDNRAFELGNAMVSAVRYQSIDNGPAMIFAVAGAILFIFMART